MHFSLYAGQTISLTKAVEALENCCKIAVCHDHHGAYGIVFSVKPSTDEYDYMIQRVKENLIIYNCEYDERLGAYVVYTGISNKRAALMLRVGAI